jgi:3-phosphoshikimate 1-carboxyvinyltransferase
MILSVQKTANLTGEVVLPSSKSQSIRGLVFALLASGVSRLSNPLDSDDMQDAIAACRQLGAEIEFNDAEVQLTSKGLPLTTTVSEVYTGNSGITTRFLMPLLGFRKNHHEPIFLDCGAQMRARPIHGLVDALKHLGLKIQYLKQENQLPIAISGQLLGGVATVPGLTSQYLSALLIALPCAPLDSEIRVHDLHERPYMEMTLNWLRGQQIHFQHLRQKEWDIFQIQGRQTYQPCNTMIPGDFSSASYFIAAGALNGGEVSLLGLDPDDPQGDKRLIAILQEMGADIQFNAKRLMIRGGRPLKGLVIDANDIPDLLPTLAVVGCVAAGKTIIKNVPQARIKETDRIHSMTEGLRRLGATIDEAADGMTIYQSKLCGALLNGYEDHRTVMALALAGMLADGCTKISDAEAINKTFPSFVTLLNTLGAKMEISHANAH